MKLETRVGLVLLAQALVLGLAANFLFRGEPLGLNVLLWTGLFVASLLLLVRLSRAPFHQGRRLMVAPLLTFAALLVWHDSPLLVAVNALAAAAALTLGALRRPSPAIRHAPLADYVGGAAAAGVATVAGVLPIVRRDIDWNDALRGTRSRRTAAIARGTLIGIPLLALFGGLFIAADAVFENYAKAALPNVDQPVLQVVFVAGFAWASGGLLRDLAAARDGERQLAPTVLAERRLPFRLGVLELVIVLGTLNALFLAFVLVQLRYLFGGRGVVEQTTHLTYAEYARHGFFELVAVAVLVLPVVLLADWILRREKRRDEVIVRALSATLIGLVLVVMASALQRMRLYEQAYGLTELRLYATGVILWLGCVFLWFAITVLRGRRREFAAGALVLGLAASLAINVLSPDALIARTNLDRPKVDVHYVAHLSDDAVPALIERLPTLPVPVRQELARELLRRPLPRSGWASWNLARARARDALIRHHDELLRYSR